MTEDNIAENKTAAQPTLHSGVLLFLAAFCGFTAFVIQTLGRPLPWLLAVMPDDVFYYLQVARNLAHTGVSTFDGETLTNGYHPGWMLLMTGLAHFFDDRIALLHACLLTGFVLHALSSLLMVRALRPFCGPFWSWVGGAFWLLNPLPLRVALQGMEGTLYMWALLLCFCIFQERITPHLRSENKFLPTRSCLVFGLSLGFAFWARTEALLLAAISLLYLGLHLWRNPQSSLFAAIRVWTLTGGAFVLCIAPWFVYSLLETGSLTQKSGAMKMLWAAQEHAQTDLLHQLLVSVVFLFVWWFSVAPAMLFNQPSNVFLLLLSLTVFVLVARRLRRQSNADASTHLWHQMAAWLLPVLIVSGAVYGGWFSDHRAWYWGQPGAIFFLLFFSGLILCFAQNRRAATLTGSAVVVYGALLCLLFSRNVPAVYGLQPGAYLSIAWTEKRVPPGARIGAFNAGVPAYFSGMKIINLDGLMNNTVADRWRSHNFDSYLREARIDYIADLQGSLDRAKPFCQGPLPLQKLDYHAPSERSLWRVIPKVHN